MLRRIINAWLDEVPVRRAVVRWLCAEGVEAYLVGGSVRDAMMGRAGHDMDVAVAGHALSLTRRLADAVRGAYVPLDAERDVARIVVRVRGEHHHIDISRLRAEGILGDLAARDFTINAMAVPLGAEAGELLDPTGGQADLAARVLRFASPEAFQQDPLRVMRAIRMRASLGCTLAPETEDSARAWASALRDVAPERLRDEFYQILMQPSASEALAYARSLGVLSILLPALAGQACQALARLAVLEELVDPTATGAEARCLASLHGRWQDELSEGRPALATLKLGCLLSVAVGAEEMPPLASRFRLSNNELQSLSGTARALAQEALRPLSVPLQRVEIYDYFRAVGEHGLDGVALALASSLYGLRCRGITAAQHEAIKQRGQQLMDAWFRQQAEIVAPPALVTGADVMHLLGLKPGPRVGVCLEAVRRAQAEGRVHTVEEALALLRILGQGSGNDAPR